MDILFVIHWAEGRDNFMPSFIDNKTLKDADIVKMVE
jgi:hypothetical protein